MRESSVVERWQQPSAKLIRIAAAGPAEALATESSGRGRTCGAGRGWR
jgi:hypothetical protein